jgi:hypothetical protein
LLVTLCITPASALTISVLDSFYDDLPFDEFPSNFLNGWIWVNSDGDYICVSFTFGFTVDKFEVNTEEDYLVYFDSSTGTSSYSRYTWDSSTNLWKLNGTYSARSDYPFNSTMYENLVYCSVPVYVDDVQVFPNGSTLDPSEPETPTEEPTDPTEPPVVDDGENDSSLLDGIKVFFGNLFKPITDLIDSIVSLGDKLNSIWERFGSLEEMWENLKGYTFDPIIEFFNSINIDSLNVIMKIWEFPIIGEFSIGKVALLVISGILILMITF